MTAGLSEHDDVTLRVLAIVESTTAAEQRRQAVRAYAERAREDPHIAEIVRLMLDARRGRANGGGNVIALRRTIRTS